MDLVWYSREIKDNIMGSIFKTLPHRCLDATYGVGVCGYTMALGVWSVYQPPPGHPPPPPPGPPGPPPDELPIVVIVLDGVKVLSSEPPVIVPLIDQYNHSSVGLEIVPPCHTLYVLFFTISGHDRSSVAPLLVKGYSNDTMTLFSASRSVTS
jgi:hypothetical protein